MIYKLRAECWFDVNRLVEKICPKTLKVDKPGLLPDCTVEFETDLPIGLVRAVLRRIPDAHVMLETVQPVAAYTGERRPVADCTCSLNSERAGPDHSETCPNYED